MKIVLREVGIDQLIGVRGDGGKRFANDSFVVFVVEEASDFVAVAVRRDISVASGLLQVFDDEIVVVKALRIRCGGLIVGIAGIWVGNGDTSVVNVIAG